MKVSEAKTKICPFLSGLGSGVAPSGDFLIDFESVKCICGDCIAWEMTKTHKQGGLQDPWDEGYDETQAEELPEDEKSGYCKRLTND